MDEYTERADRMPFPNVSFSVDGCSNHLDFTDLWRRVSISD